MLLKELICSLERTDFEQLILWDSVVVEIIFNSFYVGDVVFLKELILNS